MVLVIDDYTVIRELVQEILSEAAIETLGAANGLEGIKRFQQHRETIDVVLLDMVMPGLSGVETFHRLRMLAPRLPVLIYTSLDLDDVQMHFATDSAVQILTKTCSAQVLVASVKQVLAQTSRLTH
jgi:DNA-binding response OmpR family regulator